jgi:UDP-glucose:(heptosyl)LPS alpha-1,3-glucosyltransferase
MATPPRPRLLVVAHSLVKADGGMETVHVRLITELLDRFDVTAVACRLDPSLVDRVTFERVAVPTTPAPLRFAAFWLVATRRLARIRQPGDVVHTCGAIVGGRVDVASIHTLSAAVVAARGGRLAPPGATRVRRLNSGLLRFLALRAERHCYRPRRLGVAAAVSDATAEEVRAFYPGVAVAVTPNGVDLDVFAPDPAVAVEVRRELGLADEVVALFVGGDFERKGLGIVIEALRHAPQVHLVAAGPGDLDRAAATASAAGVADRVHLLGARRDVDRLDKMADIYVGASDYEADSLALLEAAAAGLPLVSTAVGSAATFITEGSCGIVVDRTPAAIGAALRLLAEDPARRAELGRSARTWAATRSWERSADAVAALLDRD